MFDQTSTNDDTAMAEAFANVGVSRDETTQEARERLWKETKHDPVEMMKRLDEWLRQKPERMLEMIGSYWFKLLRVYLQRPTEYEGGWKHGSTFKRKLAAVSKKNAAVRNKDAQAAWWDKKRGHADIRTELSGTTYDAVIKKEGRRRKKMGLKIVQAEVDIKTGVVVTLIDKEYGPFAHIRLGGCHLYDLTTVEALQLLDKQSVDNKFARALCRLIPDPRKPIGEQWTVEMIREARMIAERAKAA